jgi:D-alanyl-D-alanine endopeptidase (penicillin-binding protein 7)
MRKFLILFLLILSIAFSSFLSSISNAKVVEIDNSASTQTTNNKKNNDRKKVRNVQKIQREVRISVLPRANSPEATSATKKISLGTALGLGKHVDLLSLRSNAAIVVDQNTQEVLFEKNVNNVLPIASITKLMTAMTVLDSRLNLDEVLTINDEDVAIYKKSRLVKGTELTRREALLLALMSSENRAAYTLGRNFPGGISAFMTALNQKAKEIGMIRSHFEDPTGLTSKNVSTPDDLVVLVNAASQYSIIREFSTTANYTKVINRRDQEFISSNRLVRSGNMQIGLQKTGYISEAGRCLVLQAFVNHKPYIMVFLDSQGSQSRFTDAVRIKDWLEEGQEIRPLRKISFKQPINSLGVASYLTPNLNSSNTTTGHQTIESLLQENQ